MYKRQRENASNKLYGNLGQLRPAKLANPEMQIAVGGCLAQNDRDKLLISVGGNVPSAVREEQLP